jgi:hypothetical protein
MKKLFLLSAVLIAAAPTARADFRFSINIGSPFPFVVHRPPPVVACTPPVVVRVPVPVCVPPPVCAPAPVVVVPGCSPAVVYAPRFGERRDYREFRRGPERREFRGRHLDGRDYAYGDFHGYRR